MSGKPGNRYALPLWAVELACAEWTSGRAFTRAERAAFATSSANKHGLGRGKKSQKREEIVITERQIVRLRSREDFKKLEIALRAGGLEAAKVILHAHASELINLHLWGARQSAAKNDTRGLSKYTSPLIERLIPLHEEIDQPRVVHVTLHLSQKRMEALEAEAIEVTGEAIDDDGTPRALLPASEKLPRVIGEPYEP